jgi:hypothetical protein
MITVRVVTNMPGLLTTEVPGVRLDASPWPRHLGLRAPLAVFFGPEVDYILLNGSPRNIFLLAVLKMLFPWKRCRIVVLDLLLSEPRTAVDRVKTRLRARLLARTHRILLYYKDTTALQQATGLPAALFDYVPFKINQIEQVTAETPTDGGYVFCGGKTRRDFATLIEAAAGLDVPIKIVTTANEDIAQHGSFLDDAQVLPPNVEVIRLDGRPERFISLMAASRLVALPLKPDITGVGIGVYIMGMALGKCVVISEGPATRGILTPDLAMVVPPQDPAALRQALLQAWSEPALRQRLGSAAQRYALALGGEPQLLATLARWLARDLERHA